MKNNKTKKNAYILIDNYDFNFYLDINNSLNQKKKIDF